MAAMGLTQAADNALARKILARYLRQHKGHLMLLTAVQDEGNDLTVQFSSWIEDVAHQLKPKYGEHLLPFILWQVIENLLSPQLKQVFSKEDQALFECVLHCAFHPCTYLIH
jgi:hypothetical protein